MAPQPSAPPSLPPSVEEAYRRKCIQLKNRTNEVEDANDAARLRLARIKRQVEKLRIERAFLLEQLAKRTSTNVEDSEGSPSPPPTPKDKPLRIKKGHRKSAAPNAEGKTSAAAGPPSPTSETNSQAANNGKPGHTNGVSKKGKEGRTPFQLYCEEMRRTKDAGDEADLEADLKHGWEELTEAEREEYQVKSERLGKSRAKQDNGTPKKDVQEPEADKPENPDDDVEMVNYDTEDQDTQADKDLDD